MQDIKEKDWHNKVEVLMNNLFTVDDDVKSIDIQKQQLIKLRI